MNGFYARIDMLKDIVLIFVATVLMAPKDAWYASSIALNITLIVIYQLLLHQRDGSRHLCCPCGKGHHPHVRGDVATLKNFVLMSIAFRALESFTPGTSLVGCRLVVALLFFFSAIKAAHIRHLYRSMCQLDDVCTDHNHPEGEALIAKLPNGPAAAHCHNEGSFKQREAV